MLRNSCDYVHTLNMICAKSWFTGTKRTLRRIFGKANEELRLAAEAIRCKSKSKAIFVKRRGE